MNRREFLRTAGGATGAAAALGASGVATAQENESDGNESGGGGGGGEPDFSGYMADANGFGGTVEDATGQDQATVGVGTGQGLAFGPAAIHVDNGATVVWEWTGDGGQHNVVHDGDEFESGPAVAEEGNTFEYTFEEDGIYNYYCNPHESSGMLGSVVVGTDYPTVQPTGPSGPQVPDAAKSLGIAATVVMLATLGMSYVFIKFGGDYGDFDE